MTYENISPSEAKSRMDADPDAVVIDVRRPDEFVTGHIPGALNVPLADIQDGNIPACMTDKNAVYLIYCRSGVRSVLSRKWATRGWPISEAFSVGHTKSNVEETLANYSLRSNPYRLLPPS